MSEKQALLIEIGTEELPPNALDALSESFANGICAGLKQHGIEADTNAARRYGSPRRLAVYVPSVASAQPEQSSERRGPALAHALAEDGTPSKALLGFAQSCGAEVDALDKLETDKGAWFVHRQVQPGKSTASLLQDIISTALGALPIPRPMRWGDHAYSFVRPAHWLVILHGAEVIDAEVLGLRSGRQSRGHRFHHPQPVHMADADTWLESLRAAKVLADPAEREHVIRDRSRAVALKQGLDLHPQFSDELLEELVNLTEWPVPLLCRFDDEYLELPNEVLRTTMEVNQRFVSTLERSATVIPDAEVAHVSRLSSWFIGVANIESKDPDEIRKGYERVIRPRFADAKFFWDEDLKTPLAEYQQALKNVTYQKALGSVWDKCLRVAELSRMIANRVGVDAALAAHAASLSKCDLMTRMVGEFPELQGVMGRYYAAAHGEDATVAQALDEFYMPRQAGDRIANGAVSRVLAVAERIDTLTGIFALGQKPSGDKDPFALRRAALGLARTLIEADFELDLHAAFLEALELAPEGALASGLKPSKDGSKPVLDAGARRAELAIALVEFVLERLRGHYAAQGHHPSMFDAVAAVAPTSLNNFDARLQALAAFSRRPEFARLAAANKRVANILRKQAEVGDEPAARVDTAALVEPAERALATAVATARVDSARRVANAEYRAALDRLAELDQPLDAFFTEVKVVTEDPHQRSNRLALLASAHALFVAIADIARCQTGGGN